MAEAPPFIRYVVLIGTGFMLTLAGALVVTGVALAESLGALFETMGRDAGYRLAFIVGGASGILVGILTLYIGVSHLKVRFDRALEVERTRADTQAKVLEARLSSHLPPPPYRP
jgi:hypothetical protein